MEQQARRNAVELRVARAQPSELGKPTVRLPASVLDALEIGEGSIVEITGKRSTAAIAEAAPPGDEEPDVIRLDGLQRTNAGVSLGDLVTVSLADVRDSSWYGESERQVSRLFARARQVAPSVIFLDEIDSLAPQRWGGAGEPAMTERVVNTLLAEMDGLEPLQGVVVLGATNRPNLLDPALLRPGRFDELVYVSVPDERGRRRILGIHTERMPLADDVDLDALARRTPGYTGADLEDLVRRAGLQALRDDLERTEVPMAFFERALEETRASVTDAMQRDYEELARTLRQERPGTARPFGFALAAMRLPGASDRRAGRTSTGRGKRRRRT